MSYSVKEIFRTIQGEGAMAGTPAVFVRFSGCNAWSGRTQDRAIDSQRHGACAAICDTDFVAMNGPNGGRYHTDQLADQVIRVANGVRWCVLTGGEPMLQVDESLLDALKARDLMIAVETNGSSLFAGTRPDWVCVSPKPPLRLQLLEADELKVLYPLYEPVLFGDVRAKHRFVQPVTHPTDKNATDLNLQRAIAFVMRNPTWRLSIQTHKMIGLP